MFLFLLPPDSEDADEPDEELFVPVFDADVDEERDFICMNSVFSLFV